jgi:hypothetical protein
MERKTRIAELSANEVRWQVEGARTSPNTALGEPEERAWKSCDTVALA